MPNLPPGRSNRAASAMIGTMTDMRAVASGSMDALFSSHNVEHLYPHEVPVAFREFVRVLKDDGFIIVTCPDLKAVSAAVAQDRGGQQPTEPGRMLEHGDLIPGIEGDDGLKDRW